MKKYLAMIGLVAALAAVLIAGAGLAMAQTGTQPTPAPAGTAWVGVTLADLTERLATRLGMTEKTGVVIVAVVPDGPAAKAGLQVKDIVTSVDGKAVAKASEAVAAVQAKKAGDAIAFVVQRGGQSQTVTVTAAERPAGPAGHRGGFGMLGKGWPEFGPLSGLKDLDPTERFKHFLGQQFRFLDKNGGPVTLETIPGTVVDAKKDSLTIKPNDSAKQQVTYAITSDTKVMLAGGATVDTLKAGDQVVVVTSDGKTALSVSGGSGFPYGPRGDFGQKWPGGRGRFPGKGPQASPTPGTSS